MTFSLSALRLDMARLAAFSCLVGGFFLVFFLGQQRVGVLPGDALVAAVGYAQDGREDARPGLLEEPEVVLAPPC